MKNETAEQHIEANGKGGYATSVREPKSGKIIVNYVDVDDLRHCDVKQRRFPSGQTCGYPVCVGGPYDGMELVPHSVHVEKGQVI